MTTQRFLSYGRHFIDDADRVAVDEVLQGDWLTQGDTISRFEAALAERVGAKYAVAVSSATAGLHIAALAAGLKPGQRSLTSALTFLASANAALYCGAESDLGDIDADSLCLTPVAVRQAIAQRRDPHVIIPVHYAGLSANMRDIRHAAPSCGIIEDACHALGGEDVDGIPVGACRHSDMAVFSFHPVKPITTGEGGMVTTNNADLYHRMLQLRSHGIERDAEFFIDSEQAQDGDVIAPWYFEQQVLGFNYRMTDIQAALGLSQLHKLDAFTVRRRAITKRYDEAFAGVAHMKLAQNKPEQRARSAHHLYVGLFDFPAMGCTRSQFMGRLKARRIGTQVHYVPIYRHPYHKQRLGDVAVDFPETERHYATALSLPIFPAMTDEDVERVIIAVGEAVTG